MEDELVFGFPVGVLIKVGEYINYSEAAIDALDDGRYYECVTICAVILDIIINDILDNIPENEFDKKLRYKPAGAILTELEKKYKKKKEKRIIACLRKLNKLRIKVVHPASISYHDRIKPSHCPKEFAYSFFEQLDELVELTGGYSIRQYEEDLMAFINRRKRQKEKK